MSCPVVGVTYAGRARDQSSWSGTTSRLIEALEGHGVTVVAVDARPHAATRIGLQALLAPRYLRGALPYPGRVLALADLGPELGAVRSRVATRRLASAGRLDGVIQIGTDHDLTGTEAPRVTVTDRTVALALETGYPRWLALPDASKTALIDRERRVHTGAVACCALTHWAAASVRREYELSPERIHVIGVGGNTRPASPERDWMRPRFLFVGREWERKGGPVLLEAFANVRRQIPHAELHLSGGHPLVKQAGVTTHGSVDTTTVARLMATATCLVMPSLVEPAGIVHAEALAAGLPSIGTTVGGPATIIGDCGALVEPGDAGGLARAMTDMADPDRASALGKRALRRAHLFTWRAVGARVLAALGIAAGDQPAPLLLPSAIH